MKIVPAIDIIGGQCVRLSEGDFNTKKIYYSDPLDAAIAFEKAGLEQLHLVDLDGARSGQVVHWDILERIASGTNLKIDFSGGIKTEAHVERAVSSGATQVTIGSLAVKDPDTVKGWIHEYGPDRIILGADVKGEHIAIHGWQDVSELTIFNFLEDYLGAGAKWFLCTDVAKDGRLQGPSTSLYRKILSRFSGIQLIASGGVSDMDDLVELRNSGCASAIVGKAIYEGKVELEELAGF